MDRLTLALIVALTLVAGRAVAQCDDPYDEILCVPTLTQQEADQYSSTDGALAAFWDSWDNRDYIDMISPDNCYPDRCSFSGSDDANFMLKAAGTSRGLYVLTIAKDNVWVDRSDADDWGADAADLYFADQSSDDIASCSDCLVGLYSSALTYGTQQMQVWMGGSTVPTGFRYAYYDENLWSWQTVGVEWGNAKILYGIEVEVVTVDPTTKAQEWFFPWEKYGAGIPVGTPLGDMDLAFGGGYNDKDGDNIDPDCLRWLGKDPWTVEDGETYWGDLRLASDMGTVEKVLSARPQVHALQARSLAAGTPRNEFFSLRGERIPTDRIHRGTAGVVLQRNAPEQSARAARFVQMGN